VKTSVKAQFLALGYFSILLSLSGCGGAELECDSMESRKSVVRIIADDNNNALVNYAANNSSVVAAMVGRANTEADRSFIFDKAKRDAVYKLDETIRLNSKNRAAHVVTCSGILDVTVAGTTAEKQVDFRVEQAADGKMSVSVDPFLF
jgi:hypothetical protein